MNSESKHNVNEELLYRYFNEELSASDVELIENWKSESKDNLKFFDETQLLYLDQKAISQVGKEQKQYNTSSAWNQFKEIHFEKPALHIKISYTALRIAASIILLIGTGLFYWIQINSISDVTFTANADKTSLTLEDGSIVLLSDGSSITYPSSFSDQERKVKLEGKAFFDITKNPDAPFVIDLPNTQVQVLGTSFDIDASKSDSVVVSVETGKVWFKSSRDAQVLTPGLSGVFVSSSTDIRSVETPKNSIGNFWRTRTLDFDGVSLSRAVNIISKSYESNIILSGSNFENCKISVRFENEPLENVIDIISTTLSLEVQQHENQYILQGSGCE
ncbi:FecR family protein [Reichenbachiella versicolor]|uniref:FecR family protein n=1 Tax=Reichenbachiella versicolor TaxID=1821036 RepID=UPI000D6E7D2E|nr:FecR family protein [Reichenbachiella versicolor]